jgi:hypothetical protein
MICRKRWICPVGVLAIWFSISAGSLLSQTVPDQPKIDSPITATAAPGQHIVVTGTNFGAGGTLWAGTSPANVVRWSDTRIEADLSLTTTSGSLAVFRSDKQIWSKATPFFITAPPTSDNGITVTDVKVYDDATLQQMLDSARARLAGMQFLDQAGLAARLGTIQGATLRQSGFALNVGGPPIPGSQITANTGNTTTTQLQGTNTQANTGNTISTTSNGTNNQTSGSTNGAGATTSGTQNTATTNNQLQVTGPSTISTTSGSNQSQTVGPSLSTVDTLAQQNPITPTLPTTTSFTLPSSFSPAASNLLNEQVELTYETTGLAMLLEGSLSDHYIQVATDGGSAQVIRRRATIGIPISVAPAKKYADCVAEVILEITSSDASIVPQPPAVTAILPREKTYNIAAITDSSVSIGGGVVTHILSVGANGLWGHKTYYVVQDQDTVAIQLPPDPNHRSTTRVGWQIHPVLGQKTVQSGTRVLFVQLAFPSQPGVPEFGSVLVTTRWRKLDRKNNIVSSESIEGSDVTMARRFSIPSFDVTPGIQNVEGPTDNGDGTVTVRVQSEGYFAGTFVRIGTNALSAGSPNTLFEPSFISFTVPSISLATHPAYLVDRSGAYHEIRDPRADAHPTPKCLTLGKVEVKPRNSSTALVTVPWTFGSDYGCKIMTNSLAGISPIVIIGTRVFGYRDAPMQSVTDKQIAFLAPLDLLRASPYVTVKRALWGPRFEDSTTIPVTGVPVIDKALMISKSATEMRVALIGSFLDGLEAKFPSSSKIEPVSSTAAYLVTPLSAAKDAKQAVLQTPSGDLLLVAMPSDISSGPILQPHAALKSGQGGSITVQGSGLDNFDSVECNKQKLSGATLSGDKKSIVVTLPSSIVVPPAVVLEFVFKKANSLTYSIEVFDTKVDLPAQPAQPAPSTQPPQPK